MRFRPGERAPHFVAQSYDGSHIDLATLLQRKRVWLAFFRFVTCPMCNLRLHELAVKWPSLRTDDMEMIAVFQSTPASVEEWLTESRPPIRVIADEDMRLYQTYGVETSVWAAIRPEPQLRMLQARRQGIVRQAPPEGPRTRVPADFLIEQDGTLRDAYYGKHIADHIGLDRVERFVARQASSVVAPLVGQPA